MQKIYESDKKSQTEQVVKQGSSSEKMLNEMRPASYDPSASFSVGQVAQEASTFIDKEAEAKANEQNIFTQ